MSGETASSGEQNTEFKEPESDADLETIRAWAFEKAREEPLKYATWLALNAVTESVTSLQGLLEPRDKAAEEWAGEATRGGKQFPYAMWLALDATVNGLCSLQDKLQPAERWDRIKRTARGQGGERSVSEISPGPGELNYQSLLWQVLDASTDLEKAHQDLKKVQGRVTGATEAADLGVIHDRLSEIRTVFGQVRGRAQAESYFADLTRQEPLSLSELAEKNVDAALAMLPDIAADLALIAEIVVHIADAVVPVPPEHR